jgi:hypothetical protein
LWAYIDLLLALRQSTDLETTIESETDRIKQLSSSSLHPKGAQTNQELRRSKELCCEGNSWQMERSRTETRSIGQQSGQEQPKNPQDSSK